MRHIVWLAGCLLVLSCTVNNDNLNPDAGGTGGAGTGGVRATGGRIGSGGVSATGGQVGTGGQSGAGGVSATGGQVGTGGQSATGGNPGTGGSATGTGGSATGGHGAGGSGTGGAGGQGGAKTCDALETDYGTALTAAMKCTLGASGQCQQLVNRSLSCPGCKQYVNDTTELTAIQTAWDNQNCNSGGHVCPAIACVVPTTSVCTGNPTAGGPSVGADPAGTCAPQLTPTN
jgi:hypothetical protein